MPDRFHATAPPLDRTRGGPSHRLHEASDQRLVLYSPLVEHDTRAKLARLLEAPEPEPAPAPAPRALAAHKP